MAGKAMFFASSCILHMLSQYLLKFCNERILLSVYYIHVFSFVAAKWMWLSKSVMWSAIIFTRANICALPAPIACTGLIFTPMGLGRDGEWRVEREVIAAQCNLPEIAHVL